MTAQPAAPVWPIVGEEYVWEMLKPCVAMGVLVLSIYHHGGEWWVKTKGIMHAGYPIVHDLARFQEACLPYRMAMAPSIIHYVEGNPSAKAAAEELAKRYSQGGMLTIPPQVPDSEFSEIRELMAKNRRQFMARKYVDERGMVYIKPNVEITPIDWNALMKQSTPPPLPMEPGPDVVVG